MRRVSGVSSYLYESAPPSLGGEEGWKVVSRDWDMMSVECLVV